jgi:hypothetical protein
VLQDHVVILIWIELSTTLFLLALASNLKGLCLLEKDFRRLRVLGRDLSGDIIISEVDDPIEVVFGDV